MKKKITECKKCHSKNSLLFFKKIDDKICENCGHWQKDKLIEKQTLSPEAVEDAFGSTFNPNDKRYKDSQLLIDFLTQLYNKENDTELLSKIYYDHNHPTLQDFLTKEEITLGDALDEVVNHTIELIFENALI